MTNMPGLTDIPQETDIIEVRKRISKFLSKDRNSAKPDRCILCGKTHTSFCNSHSVPQFALRNIAVKGKVLLASLLVGIEDVIDIEDGVKGSGTFHFICNNCDNSFFQDYENEQNLKLPPTDKMLAEIAVKNLLLQLSKRAMEKDLYCELQEEFHAYTNLENLQEIKKLDVRDYTEELQFHKNIADKNIIGGYQVLYWSVLPYKIPIALSKDLDGNEVNNIFDMSEKVRMKFMHLAILPLKDESVILAFYHKRDKLYRKLRHQMNSSSEQKVLQFLNYIIFAYTENYFILKTIESTIESNDKLLKLGQENSGFPRMGLLGPDNLFGIGYQHIGMDEILNFLSSTWSVK